MTRKQIWTLLTALVLGVNAAPAQCPKEGCGKTCPSPSGQKTPSCSKCADSQFQLFGTGVNGDAGLVGSVILNERTFNCTKCPTAASQVGACEQCPGCDACPGCYRKCPECDGCCTEAQTCPGCTAAECREKHGTLTLGVGLRLLPGSFPLPLPILNIDITGGAAASCTPRVAPPATAAEVEEPADKEYTVETRLVEMRAGQPEQVLFAPRLTVAEGQSALVTLGDGVAQAGQRTPATGPMDGLLKVHVEELDSGNLLVDLTVQKNTVEKSGKSGTIILCRRLAAIEEVKPGKPMKLVLEKDDQGGARSWVEVVVKDAAAKADVVPPRANVGYYVPQPACECQVPCSQPVGAAPPGTPPMIPVTVFVPQTEAVPPLQPVNMMVPGPLDAAPVPCPRPTPEMIPAVVTMPAANLASVFRACKEDGHTRLEVLRGPFARLTCPSMTWGAPGCKPLKFTAAGERVHVSGGQLKAYANRVIADPEDRLVMEGQVRLTYTPTFEGGAQGVPRHLKADKITLHLQDGHLDVEMKTKSGN